MPRYEKEATQRRKAAEAARRAAEQKTLEQALSRRKMTRRGLIGLAGAAVISAVLYFGKDHIPSADSDNFGKYPSGEKRTKLNTLLRAELQRLIPTFVNAYNSIFEVNLDPNLAGSRTILVPTFSSLTPEQITNFCGRMPCNEAAGYFSPNEDSIFVNAEFIERLVPTYAGTADKYGLVRRDMVEAIMIHEITHWAPKKQPISDRFFDVFLKKLLEQRPDWTGKQIRKDHVYGSEIRFRVDELYGNTFRMVEEVEAEVIMDHYMKKVGRESHYTKDKNDVIPKHKVLYRDLLLELGGASEEHIKKLAQLRLQEGGRERWVEFIGNAFGKEGNEALEFGLDILFAIQGAKAEQYKQLIKR